jgi:hypothetical protein
LADIAKLPAYTVSCHHNPKDNHLHIGFRRWRGGRRCGACGRPVPSLDLKIGSTLARPFETPFQSRTERKKAALALLAHCDCLSRAVREPTKSLHIARLVGAEHPSQIRSETAVVNLGAKDEVAACSCAMEEST